MNKHTPGPWAISQHDDATIKSEASVVGFVFENRKSVAEIRANARLISSAPDLLASLIEILDLENDTGTVPGAEWAAKVTRAKAAIAKATGGEG